MIITCPNCTARYKVKDGLIQEKGKKVKCKKCEAVFIAYPDNRSVMKESPKPATPEAQAAKPKAPEAPAPKPPPPPVEKVQAPPAQATVKVDRSQLQNYLKKSQGAPPPVSEGSTVQIDRSEINAFIKKSQAAEPEDAMPPSDATVQVDRSQIEAFLQRSQDSGVDDGATVRMSPIQMPQEPPPEINDASTIRMSASDMQNLQAPPRPDLEDEPGFDDDLESTNPTLQEQDQETSNAPGFDFDRDEPNFDDLAESPSFDDEPFGDMETPSFDDATVAVNEPPSAEPASPALQADDAPDFDFPPTDDSSAKDPDFPSDEELGLKEDFDPVSTDAFETPDFAAFGETPQSTTPSDPPPLETAPPPVSQPPEAAKLYNARVDGNDYPNLSLESIERWIQEGRLLESDQIDDGSGHYQRADAYPEIGPFFQSFYQAHGELPQEPPQKKGFFSKIFSVFKK